MSSREREEFTMEAKDFVAFSDAIFAFAITLLAIDIRIGDIPSPDVAAQLPTSLMSLAPKLFGFFISFWIIGNFWLSFHTIYGFIKKTDRVLIYLSFFFLMLIVLLPAANYILGSYGSQRLPVIVYSVILALTGLALAAVWVYASRGHRLIDKSFEERRIRYHTGIRLIMPFIFIFSMPLVYVIPPLYVTFVWAAAWLLLIAFMNYRDGKH